MFCWLYFIPAFM